MVRKTPQKTRADTKTEALQTPDMVGRVETIDCMEMRKKLTSLRSQTEGWTPALRGLTS